MNCKHNYARVNEPRVLIQIFSMINRGRTAARKVNLHILDILFSSNHNIHKSLNGLCFWASDPLIKIFYKNLSIKGPEAKIQRPYKLL